MKLRIALLLLTSSLLAADLPFEDRFTEASLTLRKLGRGSWKIENGQAICIQNDELYKKAKDHGPMITWDIPTTDSVIEFEYLPDIDVKTMIFTVNRAKGHAFRIIATADTSRVIAFAASRDETWRMAKGARGAARCQSHDERRRQNHLTRSTRSRRP
jgi:hypothetical protein